MHFWVPHQAKSLAPTIEDLIGLWVPHQAKSLAPTIEDLIGLFM